METNLPTPMTARVVMLIYQRVLYKDVPELPAQDRPAERPAQPARPEPGRRMCWACFC